jgi:AcrR family transcriptional regulator
MGTKFETLERADEGRLARRKARTRAAILDAAGRLFHTQGFDGTSIQQVAELADTGVGTVYGYFSSKEEILHEVLRAHSDEAVERYLRAIGQETPPIEKLCLALVTFAEFIRDHRSVLHAAFPRATASSNAEHANGWLLASFRGLLQEGLDAGAFRTVPIDATARMLLGSVLMAMLGMGIWAGREDDPATLEEILAIARALLSR